MNIITFSTNISYFPYISIFLGGWIVHDLGISFAWQVLLTISKQCTTNNYFKCLIDSQNLTLKIVKSFRLPKDQPTDRQIYS